MKIMETYSDYYHFLGLSKYIHIYLYVQYVLIILNGIKVPFIYCVIMLNDREKGALYYELYLLATVEIKINDSPLRLGVLKKPRTLRLCTYYYYF